MPDAYYDSNWVHVERWDVLAGRWLRARTGYILLVLYALALCVVIPLCVNELVNRHAEVHIVIWFIAGCFVYTTVPITVSGIVQHLQNFSDPAQQLRLIRILMMVPIYSFFSYLGMIFTREAIYLDSMRECYESYVIYNFMMFLVTYMYEHYNVEQLMSYKPAQPQLWPFEKRLPPWPKGKAFVVWCKRGVFVYVISKPITTAVMLIAELSGHAKDGIFAIDSVWMWTLTIDNFSQMWALYCLVIFYQALKHELNPIKPLPKFLCVKAVVFFSFWQSMLIEFILLIGVIKSSPDGSYTAEDKAKTAQNFLICVEMLLFSIAHHYVFSHKDYCVEYELPPPKFLTSIATLFDLTDVRTDLRTQVHASVRQMQTASSSRSSHNERTPLMTSEHVEMKTFNKPMYKDDSSLEGGHI